MTYTEKRLKELARQLVDQTQAEREVKAAREKLKDEFFELLREKHERNVLRPMRRVQVPHSFFERTDLTKEEFFESRYPGWELEKEERNTASDQVIFVLRRDAAYIPDVIVLDDEDGAVKVSKTVAEYTPEIDWETLREDDPELFDRLAEPQLVYKVNEENLERMMEETPHELAKLQRHMKVRKPSLKVNIRKEKDGRDKMADR